MAFESDLRMARIAKLSRRLRFVILALLVVVVASQIIVLAVGELNWAFVWNGPEDGDARSYSNSIDTGDSTIPSGFGFRLLALLLMVPWYAVYGGILFEFQRLLALYECGIVLVKENAKRIRMIGLLLLVSPIVDIYKESFVEFLLGVAAKAVEWATDGSGFTSVHSLSIKLESDIGVVMLLGVAVIVIGHVMHEAADVAEESALTV